MIQRDIRLEPYSAMKSWCHKATGRLEVSVVRFSNLWGIFKQQQRHRNIFWPWEKRWYVAPLGRPVQRSLNIDSAIGCSRSSHNIFNRFKKDEIKRWCCITTASHYRLVQLLHVIRVTTNQQKSSKWAQINKLKMIAMMNTIKVKIFTKRWLHWWAQLKLKIFTRWAQLNLNKFSKLN